MAQCDRRYKYGEKVNPRNLSQEYLIHTHSEDDWRFDHYNLQVLHKQFAQPINVVIIVKTNIKTEEKGHVILFSTDLNLKGEKAVTNAVNLAFFMVNFSHQLLQRCRYYYHQDLSILDLKAVYRGFKYADEMIKMLPKKPETIFISQLINRVVNIGAIHPLNLI